jgi:hypothetical protein
VSELNLFRERILLIVILIFKGFSVSHFHHFPARPPQFFHEPQVISNCLLTLAHFLISMILSRANFSSSANFHDHLIPHEPHPKSADTIVMTPYLRPTTASIQISSLQTATT